jgi:hypothetical protein
MIVTSAEAERAGFSTETAVTVTVDGEGIVAGAVYSPAFEIVPTVEFPPTMLLTFQVTAVFSVSLTVAVNDSLPVPTVTLSSGGDTDTLTGEGTAIGVRQAWLPALAGAEVVALVGPTVTVAVS